MKKQLTLFLFLNFFLTIVNAQSQPNSIEGYCNEVVKEYGAFCKKYLSFHKNPNTQTNINEVINIQNQLDEMNEKLKKCVDINPIYGAKVWDCLTEISNILNTTYSSSASSYSKNNSSNQGEKICSSCKPTDSKGWYITDFNPVSRNYPNPRYILRPGYKKCSVCNGTGSCLSKCKYGKSDCPGICEDDGTCKRCHGDRFELCDRCKGSGRL